LGGRAAPALLYAALFAVSGAAALVVETVWLRWFRLLLGATAPAVAATLIAFLTGQALGAALAARRLPGARRPLALYGALELGVALWSLAVPLLLRAGEAATAALYDGLRDSPAALAALRLATALLATGPASLCLGATLPAIGAAALPSARALGAGGSALYAANLLGAALGAAAAAFWLLDAFGVSASYALALALHSGVGGAALWIGRQRGPSAAPVAERPPPAGRRPAPGRLSSGALLALAAISGCGTFAAQVLLVQALAQVLSQSAYAFGAVLVVVLTALAAGAAAVALLLRRGVLEPLTLLGGALGLAALSFAAFPALLAGATDGLRYLESAAPWPGYLWRALGVTAASAGPGLLAAALVFPALFAVAGASRAAGAPAWHLGRLLAANTAGAAAGAVAAPFALLPGLGLWPSFAALAGLYALPALLLPDSTPRLRMLRSAALCAGVAGLLAVANPLAVPLLRLEPGERALLARSTAAGVVAVVERDGERLIRTDNHYSLGGTGQRLHEERQGHLPLLLHPRAERVVFLGTATAITAGAATAHPVREIHLVEIVPGVAAAAGEFFDAANRSVQRDPRARLVVDDARNFLRATQLSFDVVVGDLFVPWRSGAGALYAREHFEAVRAHLAPGGLFCQWLPLYQLTEAQLRVVTATFLDIFPRAGLFRGDFFGGYPIAALVGFRDAPAPARAVSAAAARLGAAGEGDRWISDPVGVWSLYAGSLAPLAIALEAVPRNSDARPRIEFMAARSHAGGRGLAEPMTGLRWLRFEKELRDGGAPGEALYPDLPEAARRASLGGAMLRAAGVFHALGRAEEAGRALAAAAEHLPRHLLADAPADPSAADVWPGGR
jgi:spermidine synthase